MPIADLHLIESELFSSIGVGAFFTDRRGGASLPPYDSLNFGHDVGDDPHAVSTNIEYLLRKSGLTSPPHQARQVHGTGYIICHAEGCVHGNDADILITTESNTAVAVRTADCLPVLLADPIAKVIAAVHAGWRGTAQRVVVKAIEQMQKQGALLDNIYVTLGPSIGPCCFEIGMESASQLAASAENAYLAIKQEKKPHADLAAINIMQLKEAGILEEHIESNHRCTQCHPERFYSYRRDQGVTGRHLAVVALPNGN